MLPKKRADASRSVQRYYPGRVAGQHRVPLPSARASKQDLHQVPPQRRDRRPVPHHGDFNRASSITTNKNASGLMGIFTVTSLVSGRSGSSRCWQGE